MNGIYALSGGRRGSFWTFRARVGLEFGSFLRSEVICLSEEKVVRESEGLVLQIFRVSDLCGHNIFERN